MFLSAKDKFITKMQFARLEPLVLSVRVPIKASSEKYFARLIHLRDELSAQVTITNQWNTIYDGVCVRARPRAYSDIQLNPT